MPAPVVTAPPLGTTSYGDPMSPSRRSAGILLYRIRENRPQVLLVHPGGPLWARKDNGAWSLPKGEHADNEDPAAAALREFHEETGLDLTGADMHDLGEVVQKSGKRVRAWAAEGEFAVENLTSNTFEMPWPPRTGQTRHFPEVDRAEWYELATARDKLNPAQTAFLDRLVPELRDRGRLTP